MSKIGRHILFITLIGIFAGFQVWATDIHVDLTVGNAEFSSDRTPGEEEELSSPTLVGLSVSLQNELNDGLFVNIGAERDPILGNTVLSALRVSEGAFEVTIGPTFGILNTSRSLVRAGIAGTIEVDLWDWGILRGEARETIAPLSNAGDYQSGRISGMAGLLISNALIAGEVSTDRFERINGDKDLLATRRTRYGGFLDIFKEGVPYSVLLDLAFIRREASITPDAGSGETTTDSLGSVVFGTELSVEASETLESYIGMESNLFNFGSEELAGIDYTDSFLYTVNAGLRFSVSE